MPICGIFPKSDVSAQMPRSEYADTWRTMHSSRESVTMYSPNSGTRYNRKQPTSVKLLSLGDDIFTILK